MNSTIRRKQFLLPQYLIDEAKEVYQAKTETQAIVLSLEEAIRRKKLAKLASLAGKIQMNLTRKGLIKQRGKDRIY